MQEVFYSFSCYLQLILYKRSSQGGENECYVSARCPSRLSRGVGDTQLQLRKEAWLELKLQEARWSVEAGESRATPEPQAGPGERGVGGGGKGRKGTPFRKRGK